MSLGRYRIAPHPEPLSAELLASMARVETSTVGHGIPWGLMSRNIRPVAPGLRMLGNAVTVSIPGADSTLLHHALGLLQPGDVLVIDRLGDDRHACWGGIVTAAAQRAGAAGAIIDGPCTDLAEIRASGFPLWCRGCSPVTTRLLDWGGRLNHPVSCGGVVVGPGDVVLADEDGVLVVPRQEARAVAQHALDVQDLAANLLQDVQAGHLLGERSGASLRVRSALAADRSS